MHAGHVLISDRSRVRTHKWESLVPTGKWDTIIGGEGGLDLLEDWFLLDLAFLRTLVLLLALPCVHSSPAWTSLHATLLPESVLTQPKNVDKKKAIDFSFCCRRVPRLNSSKTEKQLKRMAGWSYLFVLLSFNIYTDLFDPLPPPLYIIERKPNP